MMDDLYQALKRITEGFEGIHWAFGMGDSRREECLRLLDEAQTVLKEFHPVEGDYAVVGGGMIPFKDWAIPGQPDKDGWQIIHFKEAK